MWQDSKLFKFLLVVFFGGSVVVIAAHDLNEEYKDRRAKAANGQRRLAQDLQGEFAQPKGPPEDGAKASPSWKIFGYELGGAGQPPAKLGSSEQKALKRVINEDNQSQ